MPGYISEYDHHGGAPGTEFVEIAVPKGTDTSGYTVVIYNSGGFVEATLTLGPVINTMGGMDVYVIDDTTPGWTYIDPGEAVALVDDVGSVLQFVSHDSNLFANNGPAAGLTSTYIGSVAIGSTDSLQSDNGGFSYYVQGVPNPGTIPCYAPGTLIRTPDGECKVERLVPGDYVETLDAGAQKVLWTRHADQPLEQLSEDHRPVLIQKGALGGGNPRRDLVVSPQHRMLVGGRGQLDFLAESEVFVPAKALTGLVGIRRKMGSKRIRWIQFALEQHHVVWAEGCLSESLLLGRMVLNGLPLAERQSLDALYPDAAPDAASLNGPPARPCMTVGQARGAIAQHSLIGA